MSAPLPRASAIIFQLAGNVTFEDFAYGYHTKVKDGFLPASCQAESLTRLGDDSVRISYRFGSFEEQDDAKEEIKTLALACGAAVPDRDRGLY